MKIQIEFDTSLDEEVVTIRCPSLTATVEQLQRTLAGVTKEQEKYVFYKGDTEYYLSLSEILFFETGTNSIDVHTADDIFQTKRKLYELEELLPGYFMRVSKSAILNTNQVYAINRNLTAASLVEFQHSHKQVYVSRSYYKALKNKLEEKRRYE
ncbi:MAG: LytTR family DNA-binding domain-containing protein [Eubacteriales bacterium]|nr:LytTR family DNA-binding domain-containing protein [Eubacteriales bacterium]